MEEKEVLKTFISKDARQYRLAASTAFGRDVLMTSKRGCNSRPSLSELFLLRWQKMAVENLPAGLSKIAKMQKVAYSIKI